jgi:hypothetical protein
MNSYVKVPQASSETAPVTYPSEKEDARPRSPALAVYSRRSDPLLASACCRT